MKMNKETEKAAILASISEELDIWLEKKDSIKDGYEYEAVQMLFYVIKDTRRMYMTYDNHRRKEIDTGITVEIAELPDASEVERGIEYILLPSGVKYVTYDNKLWSVVSSGTVNAKALPGVADAKKNYVYLIESTGEEWITCDNEKWTYITGGTGDDLVIVVDSLPDVNEARKDAIYVLKSTDEEWMTYDNIKWHLLAGSNAEGY